MLSLRYDTGFGRCPALQGWSLRRGSGSEVRHGFPLVSHRAKRRLRPSATGKNTSPTLLRSGGKGGSKPTSGFAIFFHLTVKKDGRPLMCLSSSLRASGRSVVPPPAWSFGLSDACPIMSSLSDLALASLLRFALRVYITALCKLPLLRSLKGYAFVCLRLPLRAFRTAFAPQSPSLYSPRPPFAVTVGRLQPALRSYACALVVPAPVRPQGAPSMEHNRRGNGVGLPIKRKSPCTSKRDSRALIRAALPG